MAFPVGIGFLRGVNVVRMASLGMSVCRCCGKVFERKFGRQVFCSDDCRNKADNDVRRAKRQLESSAAVQSKTELISSLPSETKFVSIKDAAALLGVSRPTIYRRIEAGELHPFKVSTKTIRIAVEELLRDCEIEQVPNSGDFSIPIKLEAALELYQVSRTKFFNAVRKAGIRPKHIRKVDYFPKKDLDRLFPAPLKYNPDEWYTVEELAASTGMTAKYVRDFARKHNLKKLRVGQNVLINRRDWNLNRFTKGQLEEDFFTVDQAKKHYHIGQEHFYEAVNAAGVERHRDGVFVYFRKADLEKLFGEDVPKIPKEITRDYVSAKDALSVYHVGQKRFSADTKAFKVEKMKAYGHMWYRREDLDRVFGKHK